jgi:transcription-repair coupling factor (superfamily II helicase)
MDYVSDDSLRLKLYRRIADVTNEDDIKLLIDEFADRFGPPPEEVQNLLFQIRVKLKAEKCGLSSITREGKYLLLRYSHSSKEKEQKELPDLGKQVRRGKNTYWLFLEGRIDWRVRLISTLELLKSQSKVIH